MAEKVFYINWSIDCEATQHSGNVVSLELSGEAFSYRIKLR